MKNIQGFSLIELMIAITIISILITLLIHNVSAYTNKSRVATILSLLNQGKIKAELVLSEENSEDYFGPKILLLPQISNECNEITAHILQNGEVKVSCLIKGNIQIERKILQWYRSGTDGKWYCESNVAEKFLPRNCNYIENIFPSNGKNP